MLNDAANREIFDGKISGALTDYRTRKPNQKAYWDYDKIGKGFRASAGDDEIAEYIASRQSSGLPGMKSRLSMGEFDKTGKLIKPNSNLRYIRWMDNSISGVLRGAQFNYKTYELLDTLSRNRMGQKQALSAIKGLADVKGSGITKPYLTNSGKILFNFSPSIKSNFDWGGYNAVVEWDYKKPNKVRLHATDLRDTPLSSFFKGKNVLNYVDSKEIDIKRIKDRGHVDMDTKPNFKRVDPSKPKVNTSQPLKDPVKIQTRKELLKSGVLKEGGIYKTIKKDLGDVKSKFERSKKRNTLESVIKKGVRSKGMGKYLRYAGRAMSAAGLAGLALQLYAESRER